MLSFTMRTATIGLVVILSGCSAAPTAPTPMAAAPTAIAAAPTGPAPAPLTEGRVFVYSASSLKSPQSYTERSRYVLYGDGTFTLEYPHVAYRGTYREAADAITFAWEGWSVAGPWASSATLADGHLDVHYNLIMQLSDFEDAAYVQRPSP
jgi:hypothetical protein